MRVLLFIGSLCLFFTGCAIGPDFEAPPAPVTQSYTEHPFLEGKGPNGQSQSFIHGKDIPAEWWALFQCKDLDNLIKKGLHQNPTLHAAQAALLQAKENLKATTSSLFPFVSIQGNGERERFSPAFFGNPALKPTTFNLYNTSVNVAYTLDLFGKVRRQMESAQAQVDYQGFEVEATYLTLTSNIVTTAITEASLHSQIQIIEKLIAAQEKLMETTQKKYNLGSTSRLDLLAHESQLAEMKTSLPPLRASLAQTRHALAVLSGELPSESQLPSFSLASLHLPTELPLSLPSTLVQQRPDVRAAEALLHAASAQVGIATADLFPQLTLTANYGWTSNKIEDLFENSSHIWNIVGNVMQPLFQGGALIAKRKAALAAFEQAYAQYQQVVLQAFQNVADTLRALESDAHQLHLQTANEDAALKTFTLTQAQYKLGTVSYLNLLDAEKKYLEASLHRIQAEARRYANTAALFQALGGGWWNRIPSNNS